MSTVTELLSSHDAVGVWNLVPGVSGNLFGMVGGTTNLSADALFQRAPV